MKKKKYISSLLAGFLLVLMALSIMPRQWLHECVSHHEHRQTISLNGQNEQVAPTEIQCHCLHVVHTQTPFLNFEPFATSYYLEYNEHSYSLFGNYFQYKSPRYLFSIHGPPAA